MDKMPVFVKIDEYKDVLSLLDTVKKKMSEARETLLKINDMKNEEDHQLDLWQNALEEIEKKVEFVDNSLNTPEKF
jgi:tetrahydromethanopterin S-methyltransferase subunit G